jgi:hypothetical protein
LVRRKEDVKLSEASGRLMHWPNNPVTGKGLSVGPERLVPSSPLRVV